MFLAGVFGISQSAFASFEVELRKLGEYEVIYDSSNHPSSEYSIDLAEFDEYKINCTRSGTFPNGRTAEGQELHYKLHKQNRETVLTSELNKKSFDFHIIEKPNFGIEKIVRGDQVGYFSDLDSELQEKAFYYVFELAGWDLVFRDFLKTIPKLGEVVKLDPVLSTYVENYVNVIPNFPLEDKNVVPRISSVTGLVKLTKIIKSDDHFLVYGSSSEQWEITIVQNEEKILKSDEIDESDEIEIIEKNKVKSSFKINRKFLYNIASGAPLIHTFSMDIQIKSEDKKKYKDEMSYGPFKGLVVCDHPSKTYSASDLGIEELVKIALAKKEIEQTRIEKQRREKEMRKEQERLATLEAERLAEVKRRQKEEVARRSREKKEALERERLAKLELKRKEKEAEEKRIREVAARERKEKEEAEATRLAEIDRKRKEAEALKKKIARAKYEDAVAVIIGNKNYTSKIHDVKFAENDADAMMRYLINLGYREGNIINLRNATQSQLRETFGAKGFHRGKLYHYIRQNESDVTVFYSGHGVPLNNNGYLLPADSNPNLIEVTGYPLKTLFENLSKIPARSMTVFIDACFSGETPKGPIVGAVSGLDVVIKLPTKQNYKDRMVIITAASSREVANWDEEAKHGLFTKYLLKALKGAADKNMKTGNQDGRVTLGEVKAYLKREMTYQSKRLLRIQNATVSGDLKTVLSTY